MKTPTYLITFVLAIVLFSCTKYVAPETVRATELEQELVFGEKKPQYGRIACSIQNDNGDYLAGERCGSPNGSCGKETACKAIKTGAKSGNIMMNGMTTNEFIEKWNNPKTRYQLEAQGYYAVDQN